MKPKRRRLWYLSLIALFLSGATLIVLTTLNDHLLFFLMPTDVLKKKPTTAFRLGGLVEEGTLQRQDNLWISFQVTDGATTIPLRYQGILPDLFREGQGVVADGTLSKEGVFIATRLLAKHDETYMPKDVADALKTTGRWKPPGEKEKTS
jgi:cytochrome c-type biogenesis protein CcmE